LQYVSVPIAKSTENKIMAIPAVTILKIFIPSEAFTYRQKKQQHKTNQ